MSAADVNRPILLVDALNLFLRHYARNPSMSVHGHHMGGTVGFLNSMRDLVGLVRPKQTFVIWESGGSVRKRAIFPGYKSGRKPMRLNRFYEDDIPDSVINIDVQKVALSRLLPHLGVCQVLGDGCEADDVIGYLCRNTFVSQRKLIASSDRDYYQLLDDETTVYSWSSRRFVGPKDALAETGIAPHNFVTAKAVCGDPSDCVPGVRGAGFKTLVKRFPALGTDADVSVQDLIDMAAAYGPGAPKVVKSIIESADVIKRNHRVMYLDVSNLAALQVRRIDAVVGSFVPSRDKLKLMRGLIDEGLPAYDAHDLFSAFL